MVLIMGISFQARHYYIGGSATAPKPSRSRWCLQIKLGLVDVVLCAFPGRLEISYRGSRKGRCIVSDSLEKRSP